MPVVRVQAVVRRPRQEQATDNQGDDEEEDSEEDRTAGPRMASRGMHEYMLAAVDHSIKPRTPNWPWRWPRGVPRL